MGFIFMFLFPTDFVSFSYKVLMWGDKSRFIGGYVGKNRAHERDSYTSGEHTLLQTGPSTNSKTKPDKTRDYEARRGLTNSSLGAAFRVDRR